VSHKRERRETKRHAPGSKRATWTLLVVALAGSGLGAQAPAEQPVEKRRPVLLWHRVVNVAELAQQEALAPPKPPVERVAPFMPMPPPQPVPLEAVPRIQPETKPELEPLGPLAPITPAVASPAPASSFEALGDNNTSIPPDTVGAVGPNHLMVTLNTEVRVQNKSGGNLSTVSLDGFWSVAGVFDPKVVYDPFTDRWYFTALFGARAANSGLLLAVSQTGDPTGSWFQFSFDADPADVVWADFPVMGFNRDWVAITTNMFPIAPGPFGGTNVWVFEKADLIAGSADTTVFAGVSGFTMAPAVTYDNTLDTLYLVDNFNGNFMGFGFLRVSTLTGPVGSEVLTLTTAFVPTPNTWDFAPPSGADFAPQRDTTDKIQVNDSRLTNLVYRNGSLWTAQTAFLPAGGAPTRASAQWWQFLPDGTVQQFGRVDDPTAVLFRAFPSIGVNTYNDVLLGYSRFSANEFASAAYSVRLGTDPLNTLRDEVVLKEGEATYFKTFSGTRNRWGDYSATAVDPANDDDLWTIQEYADSPKFMTGHDRWGTWWGRLALAVAKPANPATVTFSNAAQITISDSGTPPTAATPYPSTIDVSGLLGVITKVAVRLNGFEHTFPDDVDILLVGPTGAQATILSDVGNGGAVSGLNLLLDDAARLALPDAGVLASGTFQPTNFNADVFPAPAPAPTGGSAFSVFNGTDPNGTWRLYVVDDDNTGGNVGAITGGWELFITVGNAPTNSNTTTINDSGTPPTVATPYPSAINVAGLTGTIRKVAVQLEGLAHSFLDDMDILLVGPTGATAIILSDVGGSGVVNVDLVLDDEAAQPLPDGSIFSGTYQPTNYNNDGTDFFPPPAPMPSGTSSLSVFRGTDPNGTWSLYIVDDFTGDFGSLSSWSLLIELEGGVVFLKKRRGQVTSIP